jgi:tRNA pseudouridine55 synthase
MTRYIIDGWLNINKPLGITSAQAVAAVKRILRPEKVGHSGTLDPLADGVLPIALGEATKTVPYLMEARKSYKFTVRWGEARSTDDAEGEVVKTSPNRPSWLEIERAIPKFLGEISQVPPAYSALKVDGKRAYALARAGKPPELAPRKVKIYDFQLLQDDSSRQSTFFVTCGKGTYVRSLARDIALALDTVGYVSALTRTKVGAFTLDHAISLDFLEKIMHNPDSANGLSLAELLWPLSAALDDIPALTVDQAEAARLVHGQGIAARGLDHDGAIALFYNQDLVAIGERRGRVIAPKRVFNLHQHKETEDVDYS